MGKNLKLFHFDDYYLPFDMSLISTFSSIQEFSIKWFIEMHNE